MVRAATAPARQRSGEHLVALSLFAALALFGLRPIWRVFSTHLAPDLGDPLLNLVFLKWGVHQLRLGLPDFWNANFFHPTAGVMAFSDHLLGPAAQLYLLSPLIPNPIAGYNLLLFTAYLFAGFNTYWVLRQTNFSWAAAMAGGLAFTFGPYRWEQSPHIQIVLAHWIPLLLWLWDRLLAEASPRRGALFLLVYLLHISGGSYLAFMAHIPLLVLLLNRLGDVRRQLRQARPRLVLGTVALASAGAAASFLLPYLIFSRELGLERHAREHQIFGASLLSYLSPSYWNLYWGSFFRRIHRWENGLFAGFLPSLLAILGWAWGRGRRRETGTKPTLSAGRRLALALPLALALAGFALGEWRTLRGAERFTGLGLSISLKDYLQPFLLFALGLAAWWWLRRRWRAGGSGLESRGATWERGLLLSGTAAALLAFPIVFVPLARVVPGLGGMRVPTRFYVFASLAIAYLAAAGVDALRARCPGLNWSRLCALLLVALIAVELTPRPLRWFALPGEKEFPAADQWLAQSDEVQAIVDLPLAPAGKLHRESLTMYLSSLHWKPLVNGFSGYLAPSYLAVRQAIEFLPDNQDLELLRRLGVTHVVVRPGRFSRDRQRRLDFQEWDRAVGSAHGPELERIVEDAGGYLYRILPRAAPARSARPTP